MNLSRNLFTSLRSLPNSLLVGATRVATATAIGALALHMGFSTAFANESEASATDKARVAEFKEKLKELKSERKKDLLDAKNFAARVVKAFPTLTDEKQKVAAVDLIGSIAKLSRDDAYLHLSMETLAELGHPRGAKYLKRHLKMRGEDDARDSLKIAIRAAAKVPDDSLVSYLLRAYEKSEIMSVRVMACQTLGHYGSLKRSRGKIVKALVKVVKRFRPSAGYQTDPDRDLKDGRRAGSDGGEVWAALAGRVPSALNQLTGQSVASMDQWFDVFDHHKRKLNSLFPAAE